MAAVKSVVVEESPSVTFPADVISILLPLASILPIAIFPLALESIILPLAVVQLAVMPSISEIVKIAGLRINSASIKATSVLRTVSFPPE